MHIIFFNKVSHMTKRFFITRFNKTSYMIIHDFYIEFHDKFKFSSFVIIQNSLFSASIIEQQMRFRQMRFRQMRFRQMRFRQMRITSYFKSTVCSTFKSTIKLISNKKYVDLKVFVKSI